MHSGAHSLTAESDMRRRKMNYHDDWRRLFFNLSGSKIKKELCVFFCQCRWESTMTLTSLPPPTHTHTQTHTQTQFSDLSLVFYDICTGGDNMAGGRAREREREREGGYHGNWSSKIWQRCTGFTAWCGMNKNHPVSELWHADMLVSWPGESVRTHLDRLDTDV